MHKITCRFSIIPYAKLIEWIITYIYDSHLVICSKSGGHLSTYYGEGMKMYYKIFRPTKYANDDFYIRWVDLDTSNIIKSQCQEPAKFLHHPYVVYPTNIIIYVE